MVARLDPELDMSHLDAIAAISGFAIEPAARAAEVTVGFIAEQLSIDPSRASRLVAEIVERGYARRVASQADSRRICLELTDKGETFVDSFRQLKWQAFAQSLGRWSEADLVSFAALLDRFSGWTRSLIEGPATVQEKRVRMSEKA
jgi:DNA-binding MarR family transcriptional regulator